MFHYFFQSQKVGMPFRSRYLLFEFARCDPLPLCLFINETIKLCRFRHICVFNLQLGCFYLQIWVYGDSFKSKLIAVVVPHQENIKKWANQNGFGGSFSDLCSLSQLQDYVLLQLKSTAVRNKVSFNSADTFYFFYYDYQYFDLFPFNNLEHMPNFLHSGVSVSICDL